MLGDITYTFPDANKPTSCTPDERSISFASTNRIASRRGKGLKPQRYTSQNPDEKGRIAGVATRLY